MGTVELLDEIILYVDCISISGVTSDCEIIAPYPFVVSVATFPSAAHMQGPLGRENTCAAWVFEGPTHYLRLSTDADCAMIISISPHLSHNCQWRIFQVRCRLTQRHVGLCRYLCSRIWIGKSVHAKTWLFGQFSFSFLQWGRNCEVFAGIGRSLEWVFAFRVWKFIMVLNNLSRPR